MSERALTVVGASESYVDGSVSRVCEQCGARVWLAPYTQTAMAEAKAHGSTVRLVCTGCVPRNQPIDLKITPEQLVETRAAFLRDFGFEPTEAELRKIVQDWLDGRRTD